MLAVEGEGFGALHLGVRGARRVVNFLTRWTMHQMLRNGDTSDPAESRAWGWRFRTSTYAGTVGDARRVLSRGYRSRGAQKAPTMCLVGAFVCPWPDSDRHPPVSEAGAPSLELQGHG
jgi:hypothetical protein